MTRFILLALCLVLPAPILAQTADVTCDDQRRMTRTLTHVLGAERQGMGLRDPETMLEIWVTQSTGDWVIVQSYANGTACIIAMGEHWDAIAPGPA